MIMTPRKRLGRQLTALVTWHGAAGRGVESAARWTVLARLQPTNRALAIIALIGANLIWGTTFVATKPMLDRIPPLTVASLRFMIALLVLLPLLSRTGGKPARGSSVALMGFTGVFLVYFCQNLGLQYTSAANGALIHGGIPIFTALIAASFLRERLTWTRSIGIGASLAGVATVVLMSGGSSIGVSITGDALVLGSGIALAAYFVLGRLAFPSGNSLELVAGVARYGLLFLFPASLIELWVVGMSWPTLVDLLGLLYLGAAASALAFVLWGYGLRHMEAAQATTFANLSPLVGLIVAALLLGERVTGIQIGGGLMIIAGVWIATGNPAQIVVRMLPARRAELPVPNPATN
jgi:drug/metabolite transporter (DMT)-like permease